MKFVEDLEQLFVFVDPDVPAFSIHSLNVFGGVQESRRQMVLVHFGHLKIDNPLNE